MLTILGIMCLCAGAFMLYFGLDAPPGGRPPDRRADPIGYDSYYRNYYSSHNEMIAFFVIGLCLLALSKGCA